MQCWLGDICRLWKYRTFKMIWWPDALKPSLRCAVTLDLDWAAAMISRHYFHIFYFFANVMFDKINDAFPAFTSVNESLKYQLCMSRTNTDYFSLGNVPIQIQINISWHVSEKGKNYQLYNILTELSFPATVLETTNLIYHTNIFKNCV